MSVKPKRQILTDSLPSFASKVDACLTVSDMSVRIAAAKCLAFINELLMVVRRNVDMECRLPHMSV